MKRIYVEEKWCLGCHLCEYECAFANSGMTDMVKALKGKTIHPKIRVEDGKNVHFAVNCRHCKDAICVNSCIAGALSRSESGVVEIDRNKCVGCFTCVLVCPYGAVMPDGDGHVAQKCELCTKNLCGEPNCVAHCPNRAIVYEERD
ncbi:MAG: 4Fe-4S dicluster domain-containing protein [Clostridia bacterium]|nr:4Fe-4S dicluster domain-containing protein [Clostridia bacterium]